MEFCIAALGEALARFGQPEILNADQGSQFTSPRFTGVLPQAGTRISMDGRGRWMDNVFIERLWRSLKYECICLHAFETSSELRAGFAKRIGCCNTPAAALYIGRAYARRSIRRACIGETGRLTATRTKLNSTAKLSNRTGPPQPRNSAKLS